MSKIEKLQFKTVPPHFEWRDGWLMWNKINEIVEYINNTKSIVYCKCCCYWDYENVSIEGTARCLTGESGIRYRTCNDFCSRGKNKGQCYD